MDTIASVDGIGSPGYIMIRLGRNPIGNSVESSGGPYIYIYATYTYIYIYMYIYIYLYIYIEINR